MNILKLDLQYQMVCINKLSKYIKTLVQKKNIKMNDKFISLDIETGVIKKTPGIDNITWKSPADRMNAIIELGEITKNSKSYKVSLLKRVMIPKTNSKELRPLD